MQTLPKKVVGTKTKSLNMLGAVFSLDVCVVGLGSVNRESTSGVLWNSQVQAFPEMLARQGTE